MDPRTPRIRRLVESDAEAYLRLRREALLEDPLAFASSPEDDFASTEEAVREHLGGGPEAVILGAFVPELAGMGGVYRERKRKESHKAHVWGLYVTPSRRGQGLGRGLLEALVAHAESLPGIEWVHLGVNSTAQGARRLYEGCGFRLWGTQADAIRHEGRTVDKHCLALRLTSRERP